MAKKAKKAKKKKRSSSANTGRESNGAFAKGNQLSVGNKGKSSETATELKKALLDAVSENDIKVIARKLVAKAKKGDVPAAKELFDRIWGKAKQEIGGEINVIETSKPLSIDEMKKRILAAGEAGTGLDNRSIKGGNENSS